MRKQPRFALLNVPSEDLRQIESWHVLRGNMTALMPSAARVKQFKSIPYESERDP